MTDWQQGDIDAGGVSIHYTRTGGAGPALVLAHGVTDNGLCWRRFAEAMAGDFDVVMLDARGHGQSARIGDGLPGDHADDVAGAIAALGLDRPHVVGHSMGARTMAKFAADHPEMVGKIVLEDPPFREWESSGSAGRGDGFRKWIESMAEMTVDEIAIAGKANNPHWHDDEFPDWAESKKQVDADVMKSLKLDAWQDVAAGIEAPTLLVYGDTGKGGIVSAETAAEACELNPLIQARHIPDSGHNIRRDRFDTFVATVRDFLLAG